MPALIEHVALLSESKRVPIGDVMKVAMALQKQASRDLAPVWDISATVDPVEKLEDVPPGYWPIIIMDDIGFDGAAGIHLDRNGQPFALVTSSTDRDVWSLTASHELLEMLVDPFGNRLVAGDSPKPDQGRVEFLVEVSDPSEAAEFGYTVNGILVSDFYTPRFFDPFVADGVRYSFTGAIKRPRQVLEGGYLSWLDPASGSWFQETWFGGAQSEFVELGKLDQSNGSFRSQIDKLTYSQTAKSIAPGRKASVVAGVTAKRVGDASSAMAKAWREQIASLTKRTQAADRARAEPRNDARRRAKGFVLGD